MLVGGGVILQHVQQLLYYLSLHKSDFTLILSELKK